jgi:hypothetical protein
MIKVDDFFTNGPTGEYFISGRAKKIVVYGIFSPGYDRQFPKSFKVGGMDLISAVHANCDIVLD